MRSLILSQCRDLRIGVMWQNVGALTTTRAREFWITWRRFVCFLSLNKQVVQPVVGPPQYATLYLTFRPLNGVTGHRVIGFLPANFQLATYALPFSTGTRQRNNGHQCVIPPTYGGIMNVTSCKRIPADKKSTISFSLTTAATTSH